MRFYSTRYYIWPGVGTLHPLSSYQKYFLNVILSRFYVLWTSISQNIFGGYALWASTRALPWTYWGAYSTPQTQLLFTLRARFVLIYFGHLWRYRCRLFSVLTPDYVKIWMDFNVLLFLINLWLLKFDEERNLQSFLYITFQIPAWVTDTKISGLWVYGSIGKIAQNMTNINNEKKKRYLSRNVSH